MNKIAIVIRMQTVPPNIYQKRIPDPSEMGSAISRFSTSSPLPLRLDGKTASLHVRDDGDCMIAIREPLAKLWVNPTDIIGGDD